MNALEKVYSEIQAMDQQLLSNEAGMIAELTDGYPKYPQLVATFVEAANTNPDAAVRSLLQLGMLVEREMKRIVV